MGSKRKFKRDYIILEAKDMNFRYKERVLPKAFAKIEINEDKSVVALYVENLKHMRDGYRVVAIQSDYETLDLGKINLSEQGKGEFVLNLDNSEEEIKGIAILYDRSIPLIGFKGNKIDNYEEILFMGNEEEYEEYINTDEEEGRQDNQENTINQPQEYITNQPDEYEYEEVEYIDVEEDDFGEYEEIEYEYIEDDDFYNDDDFDEDDEMQSQQQQQPGMQPGLQQGTQPQLTPHPQQKQLPQSGRKYYEELSYNKTDKSKNKNNHKKSRNQQQDTNQRVPGTLLMPRQIKKGLKYFKEVKPFAGEYIDDTRWWKIEINPTTLCGYTMPYLGYVNTLNYTMYSDAVMQSYKYRHYLFGVQYDEYNKRKNYIYAVPGHKEEQPDKGHTGFTMYQACDNRNDKLGYWLCFIDSRSRKIVK